MNLAAFLRKMLTLTASNPFALIGLALLLLVFTSAYRINQIYAHTQQLESNVQALIEQQKTLNAQIAAQRTAEQPKSEATGTTTPQQDAINDIFMASSDSDTQSKLDTVKKRYEEILVTYMYLQRCKLNRTEDYHIINSALAQELASLNGPARVQYDTITAAKGSYEGVYSRTPCNQADSGKLVEQYNAFIDAIKTRFGLPVL